MKYLFLFFLFSCQPDDQINTNRERNKKAINDQSISRKQASVSTSTNLLKLVDVYSHLEIMDNSTKNYRAITLFTEATIESNYNEYAICEKERPQTCFPSKEKPKRLQLKEKFIPIFSLRSGLIISVRECEPLTLDYSLKNCGPWKDQDFNFKQPAPTLKNFSLTEASCYTNIPEENKKETLGFYSYHDKNIELNCEKMVKGLMNLKNKPRIQTYFQKNFSQSSGTNCYELFSGNENNLYALLNEEKNNYNLSKTKESFSLVEEEQLGKTTTLTLDPNPINRNNLESNEMPNTIEIKLPTLSLAEEIINSEEVLSQIEDYQELLLNIDNSRSEGASDRAVSTDNHSDNNENNSNENTNNDSSEGLDSGATAGIIIGVAIPVLAGVIAGSVMAIKNKSKIAPGQSNIDKATASNILNNTDIERGDNNFLRKLKEFFGGNKSIQRAKPRGIEISPLENQKIKKIEAEIKSDRAGKNINFINNMLASKKRFSPPKTKLGLTQEKHFKIMDFLSLYKSLQESKICLEEFKNKQTN